MSMIAAYLRVSPLALETVAAKESLLRALIDHEKEVEEAIDIDKAWDGLHYLLSEERRSGATNAGHPIDLGGYFVHGLKPVIPGVCTPGGEIRCLTRPDISRVLSWAASVSGLEGKFDAVAMQRMRVYPQGWIKERDERLAELISAFAKLSEFYSRCDSRNHCVIAFLT